MMMKKKKKHIYLSSYNTESNTKNACPPQYTVHQTVRRRETSARTTGTTDRPKDFVGNHDNVTTSLHDCMTTFWMEVTLSPPIYRPTLPTAPPSFATLTKSSHLLLTVHTLHSYPTS